MHERGEFILFRILNRSIPGLLIAILLLPAVIWGQTAPSTIRGQVLDPSGAAVPAIEVQLTAVGRTKLSAQTDDQGRYTFPNLTPGTYTLTIQLQGFVDIVKPGII